jgi:hypothetical protein
MHPPQDDQIAKSLIAISHTILVMSDNDNLSLLAISGFHSPRSRLSDHLSPQIPVVIRAGDLTLQASHSNDKFNIAIQRKIAPLATNIPHGVLLSIPLYYLTSIFIFDHGLHGHSMRVRLISPNRAFRLSGGATVPAHHRYMLDEFGKPSMLYPCHLNDHFDLLGILQGREVVLQISGGMSMEAVVDWAARLKDTAASKMTSLQVLFDNPETGRVSQLKDLPDRLQPSPEAIKFAAAITRSPSNSSFPSESRIPTQPAAMAKKRKQEITPPESKSDKRAKTSSNTSDDDGLWCRRQRLLRPNSPSRHYRPQYTPPDDPSRFYRPDTAKVPDPNSTGEQSNEMAVDEVPESPSDVVDGIKDEGLSDGSTVGEASQEHQFGGTSCIELDLVGIAV